MTGPWDLTEAQRQQFREAHAQAKEKTMAQNEQRYIAHFTPEAWIRDQAIEVNAEGPQEWDATTYARQHLDYLARTGRRRGEHLDDPAGVLDNDDVFAGDPAAPEWVRTWQGPFTIRVRQEVPS